MPSLSDFVEALKAGWFPALAALVASGIVIAGDWFQVPYLSQIPAWLLTTTVIVAVVSFSILVANLAYVPKYVLHVMRRNNEYKKFKDSIEQQVLNAPEQERKVLAYLVTTGRKAVAAKHDDRRLTTLVAKGMMERQSGQHSVLEWPYVVQDDVWNFLLANKKKFLFKNAGNIPDPFDHRHSRRIGSDPF